MKEGFEKALRADPPPPEETEAKERARWQIKFMIKPAGTFMAYWYSSLFVVCEGWKDLKLSDPTTDALLADPNLEILRRFRNGACHYQPDYLDPRFMDFQSAPGTVKWIRDLSGAFGTWFLAKINAK